MKTLFFLSFFGPFFVWDIYKAKEKARIYLVIFLFLYLFMSTMDISAMTDKQREYNIEMRDYHHDEYNRRLGNCSDLMSQYQEDFAEKEHMIAFFKASVAGLYNANKGPIICICSIFTTLFIDYGFNEIKFWRDIDYELMYADIHADMWDFYKRCLELG